MPHSFHVVFEMDDDWYIGYCPELPGANGQGKTKEECRQNVLDAVELILQYRLEQGLKGIPDGALVETLAI
jgi:predicted RNase H-like HicB family nuclease